MNASQVELGAQAAQVAMRKHKSALKSAGPKAVMPGGLLIDATDYLEAMHGAQDQTSIFSDIDRNPEKYLKDPRPGYRYLWIPLPNPSMPHVNASAMEAAARISSGRYVEIGTDELKSDSELPYRAGEAIKAKPSTHEGTRNTVIIYDLKLVAVSPKAWKELFEIREAMGVARIASDTERFYEQMESLGAVGEVTSEMVQDTLVPAPKAAHVGGLVKDQA